MRTGFPNLGTPLATSRETRPTQWLNFSRQINIGVYPCLSVVKFKKSRLMQEI
ncbi:MAG: hypothetical protein KME40_05450 [Komarekiella atlantica HA4396-MV6]|nr:hypothetical protein [Komarekiella atlantica HA4396-MV6]